MAAQAFLTPAALAMSIATALRTQTQQIEILLLECNHKAIIDHATI